MNKKIEKKNNTIESVFPKDKHNMSKSAKKIISSDEKIINPVKKSVKKLLVKDVKKDDNVSPLRYPGGKTRACVKLDNILNEYFKIDSIKLLVSPFFGGGSFEFFVQNKYNIPIIANDKFTPLFNFWNCAKTKNEDLYNNLCTKIDVTKDQFTKYRDEIMDHADEPLKQAIYYFIINRCSFSGATLSGGFSEEASKGRFTQSSIERIKKLNLSNIEFFNDDFSDFLNKKFIKNRIVFLDPPYYLGKGSKLYGKNGDMHENFDHNELYKKISKKNKWIMTYNDCKFIRDLYKNFTIVDIDWTYGMNKTKKSLEIVIISN